MTEREPAIRVGRLTVVAERDPGRRGRLADRLAARGWEVRHAAHFTACGGPAGRVLLLHPFGEATVDEDLAPLIAEELGPLGVVTSAREYGEALFAVVASTCPAATPCPTCGRVHVDLPAIWRHYCLNTLRRLRPLVDRPPAAPASHVERFATVYRAVIDRCAGAGVLDVGSSLGFLPVLLAERRPDLEVAGCDNRVDAVRCAADLSAVAVGGRAAFSVRDVLDPGFAGAGRHDTVTAVHVLEHFTDAELPVALASLLGVTARRLIVAVPYEDEVQPLYGHEQRFTPERLRALGARCVESVGGGRFTCAEACGGLLVVDRENPPPRGREEGGGPVPHRGTAPVDPR
ncbi:MAG TPA: class I SAM-dependent methyltransferase [Candidatus Dormibacteraeota bacterium]